MLEVKFSSTITTTFSLITCGGCGIHYYVPEDWKSKKIQAHGSFSCPNGCSRVFTAETEAEKVKRELDNVRRQLANKSVEKIQVEAELEKTQKQLKRVHKGTCPCCKRSFQNLHNHMKTKHPELAK